MSNQTKSEIVLFVLPGCGHCVNAEKVLKEQIDSNIIEKRMHTEAKDLGFRGFPALVRLSDGATNLGCPKSYEDLLKAFDNSKTKLTPAQKMKLNKIKPILKKHRNILKNKEPKKVVIEDVKETDVITFFNMDGCAFCARAKELLSDEIEAGKVIVKAHTEAPPGTSGFPTFTYKDKTEVGLMKSFEELASKLQYGEHFIQPTEKKETITENFIIRQEEQKQAEMKETENIETKQLIPLTEDNKESFISSNKHVKGQMPLKNYVKPMPQHHMRQVPPNFIGVL
jgi:glutaredoxin